MTKVNCPIQRTVPQRLRRWRWWLMTSAAFVCGTMLAVTHGAEQVDSGWALAIPAPLAKDPTSTNHQQELLLRRLLDQTHQPLLQKPLPNAATPAKSEPAGSGLRFAVRPDGVDGWRQAAQAATPPAGEAAEKAAGPRLGAPIAATPSDTDECDADEGDCSGPSPAQTPATDAEQPEPQLSAPEISTTEQVEPDALDEEDAPQPDAAQELEPQDFSAAPIDEATTPIEDEAAAPQESVTPNSPDNGATQPPAANSSNAPVHPPHPPLTKQLLSLRTRVRSVLKGYYRKPLNSREHDPWEVMHGMLAYGVQSRIRQGGPNGNLITSVGWLCYNKPCKGQTLLYVTPAGEVRAKYGVGLQGHLGQLLAMLAQCHVSADYPIHIGRNEFTIHDLIEAEKKTCYPKSELTFKLLALQHYIDLNDKWVNDQGVEWDFPRLVREELAQPIRGAACGGTHRLSGLSLTVKTRLRRGEPLDGEYLRAAQFVKKYQQYAFRLQNRDGSLSTSWFRGSGDDDDINRRIKTTGHILEWLCYSLNDDELRDPRTIRAVTYLANLMYYNYENKWEVGPMCHATHALLLYDERVFEPHDKEGAVATYRSPTHVARRTPSDTLQR